MRVRSIREEIVCLGRPSLFASFGGVVDSLQVARGGGVEDVEPVRGIVVEVVPQLVHVLEPHVRVHVIEIFTCKQFLRKPQIIPNLRLSHPWS